jgi:hypothetical protein
MARTPSVLGLLAKHGLKKPRALKPMLRMLQMAKAPSVVGLLISYIMLGMPPETYDEPRWVSMESFAGERQYTDSWIEVGEKAVALDLKYDVGMDNPNDINSSLGFAMHLNRLLQTELVSLWAPVCSTFTQINAGTSGRRLGRPLGWGSATNCYHNKMVSRVLLLLWVAIASGTMFILEQPAGSWMETHPRFQQFCKEHKVKRHKVEMKENLPDHCTY